MGPGCGVSTTRSVPYEDEIRSVAAGYAEVGLSCLELTSLSAPTRLHRSQGRY